MAARELSGNVGHGQSSKNVSPLTLHLTGLTLPDDCAARMPNHAHMSQPVAVTLVLLLFAEIVTRNPEPQVMAVGLAPLAFIAAEAAWHLMTSFEERP